jgi:hypothetical protein
MRHEALGTRMSAWWTTTRLEPGAGRRWRLGPLELSLVRTEAEWHMAHGYAEGDGPETGDGSVEPLAELPEDAPSPERFAAGAGADRVRLLPRCAERSVVARPRMPLHVLAGYQTKIHVSSPVWVEVLIGPPFQAVQEVPTRRLSDTWFGPSTREGEVAFALKTHARVRLSEIPWQPYRAITPVVIENRSEERLTLDRMNLPVPYLSIFADDGGRLWTESIVLAHHAGSAMATLDIHPGPPAEAGDARLVSPPRRAAQGNLLVRAFSTLLGSLDPED